MIESYKKVKKVHLDAKNGTRSDKKDDWIRPRLGLHPETDRKQLWRLLKRC